MIVTTYTCDKCGHKQTDNEQMWEMEVRVRHHGSSRSSLDSPKSKALWCRRCVEKLHLLPAPEDKPVTTPPPSFEQVVRNIIREEIEASQ